MVIRLIASVTFVALVGCQKQTVINRKPISPVASDNTIPLQQTLYIKTTVPPFWPPHEFVGEGSGREFMNIVHRRARGDEKVEKVNSLN